VRDVKAFAERVGLTVLAEAPSALRGPAGNVEFFLDLAVPARG